MFLPREEKLQNKILNIMIEEIEREGLELMHLRNVPVNEDVPGVAAREVMPDIRQMFVAPMPSLSTSSEGEDAVSLENKLYKVRKRIERRVLPLGIDSFYICSCLPRTLFIKVCLRADSCAASIRTLPILTSLRDWRWCIADSPPILSLMETRSTLPLALS